MYVKNQKKKKTCEENRNRRQPTGGLKKELQSGKPKLSAAFNCTFSLSQGKVLIVLVPQFTKFIKQTDTYVQTKMFLVIVKNNELV